MRRSSGTTRPGRLRAAVVAVATMAAGLLLLLTPAHADDPVTLLYFGADGCPYCEQLEAHLDDLEERVGDRLVVERYEVSGDPAARDRWVAEMAARGQQASGVPTTILGDRVWVGFDQRIAADLDATVLAAVADVADDPVGGEPEAVDASPEVVQIPLLGEVRLAERSPLAATALIAFVDGFNPCSLWVLTVLLAMVLHAGATRARVVAVGATFLVVTGLLYGAFIAGLFTVMGFVQHLEAIRWAVALLALVVGAINVKDYVAYRRGPSLTIPDRFKPRIYRFGRAIRDPRRPLLVVLGTTVAMAAGISLVELPCTAGFPVVWTGILRTQGVEGLEFAGLLGVYLLIYVLDELLVFAVVVATLQVARFQERHGRLLKLVGGTVMIALGLTLLLAPALMESLVGSLLVVAGAVVLAVLVAGVHRLA